MELAVLLAAGLRDWVDFGVIVSWDDILIVCHANAADLDCHIRIECFCWMVSGETGGRYRSATESLNRFESYSKYSDYMPLPFILDVLRYRSSATVGK